MAVVLGLDTKMFYATPGANPTYTELGNVKNVTINLESAEADVTVRANNGWRATVPTLRDASIEFEMVYDTTDAGFIAMRAAYFASSDVLLKVLDGGTATTGTGLVATCRITNFTISQGLEESVNVNVSAKPTYGSAPPYWQEGGAAMSQNSVESGV
jgi:hypothetical protein